MRPTIFYIKTYFAIIENGDGKLSVDEVMEHHKKNGEQAPPKRVVDAIKKHAGADGKLDKAEFIKLIKEMLAAPPPQGSGSGSGASDAHTSSAGSGSRSGAPATPKCQPPAEDANTTPKQHIANLWELIVCEADSKYKTFNCPNIIFIKLFD